MLWSQKPSESNGNFCLVIVHFIFFLLQTPFRHATCLLSNSSNRVTDMKILMMKKYSITPEDYKMLEIVMTENKPNKSGPQWKFAGSFYFATVVLATIGNRR